MGLASEGPNLQPEKQGTSDPSKRTWKRSSRHQSHPRLRYLPHRGSDPFAWAALTLK